MIRRTLIILPVILFVFIGCKDKWHPDATVTDGRKRWGGDTGFLYVDIRFADGHREGYNITVGERLIDRLKRENDSLSEMIRSAQGTYPVTESADPFIEDNPELAQRYSDSIRKYLHLYVYLKEHGLPSEKAHQAELFYCRELNKYYKPEPSAPQAKPADANVYTPKP